ncbi:MAG: TIGR03067 domain-containing protein [Acidobacteria bacterium]|nr:MAG: TIGR03067 domain-containing protein [Acidobacteriota bacterium]
MKRLTVGLVCLLSVAVAAQSALKKEFQALQGTWMLVSAGGDEVPAGLAGLAFSGEKYEGLTEDKITERGTVRLDPSTKPMAIDLVILQGDDAGKVQLGLVEVSGDKMTLFLANPGDPKRPSPSDKDAKLILKRLKQMR